MIALNIVIIICLGSILRRLACESPASEFIVLNIQIPVSTRPNEAELLEMKPISRFSISTAEESDAES